MLWGRVMYVARYGHTSIDYLLTLQIDDLDDITRALTDIVKREQEE